MNLVHLRQSLSRSGRILFPLCAWKYNQFNVVITRTRIETNSGPLPCHRRISEAHVIRTGAAAVRPGVALFPQKQPFPRERALPHDGQYARMK